MKLPPYLWILLPAVGGLVAALVITQRDRAELQERVTALSRRNAELRFQIKQAEAGAAEAHQAATGLDALLGRAKSRADASELRSGDLSQALADARASLSSREQFESDLRLEIETLRSQLAAGGTGGEAADLQRRVTSLQSQLVDLLTRALDEPAAAVANEPHPVQPVVRPAPALLRIGARQAFVVINFGTEQGGRIGQVLAVRQGTSEVATVQISSIRPQFAIAQVLPDTVKGQLQPGDIVVLQP